MSALLRDLRLASTRLARDRGFTFVAVLTLALTIGLNTALFSVVNAVLLAPLPYPTPERLVTLYNSYPEAGVVRGSNALPDYFDRREMGDTFEQVALYDFEPYNLKLDGDPERVVGLRATPELFSLLGTSPQIGAFFGLEALEVGNDATVLLSDGLWRRAYAASPEVVGSTLDLSGVSYRVIGVLPPEFEVLDRVPQLVVPLSSSAEQRTDGNRHSNFANMLARLGPGVGVEVARQRLETVNATITERLPYREMLESAQFRTVVTPLGESMVAPVRGPLVLLQAAVFVVLLIGCLNIANLMLIRSNRRLGELAVRFSLGAGRFRIARQLLTESLALSTAGGVLGTLLGYWAVAALSTFGIDRLPRGGTVEVDTAVLLFTLALALATGLVFGLIPLPRLLRSDLSQIFRQGGRSGSAARGASWLRSSLVVFQVAMAFVLLVSAGLLLVSFERVTSIDLGFEAQGVATARLELPESRYPEPTDIERFIGAALEEVRAQPGITAAGLTDFLPFGSTESSNVIVIDGHTLAEGESPPVPFIADVDHGYLDTLGVAFLEGRGFERTDTGSSQPVAIIDQDLARRYWPERSPLGARLATQVGDAGTEDNPWYTVVGVIASVETDDPSAEDKVGTVYIPLTQAPTRSLYLAARTAGDVAGLSSALKRAVGQVDPDLPLADLRALSARVDDRLAPRRTPMRLLTAFAGLALLLAATGIYGVLAYAVRLRRKELGIRGALGASPRRVVQLVLRDGGLLVGLGLILGIAAAIATGRLLSSELYGISAHDLTTFSAVGALLALVGLAAAFVPARSASRVDPVVVLHGD